MTEELIEKTEKIKEFAKNFLSNKKKEETLVILYSDGKETFSQVDSTKKNLAIVLLNFLANNPELMSDMTELSNDPSNQPETK